MRLSAAGSVSHALPGFAFPFSAKTAAAALYKHRATIQSGGSRSKYGAIAFVRYRPRRPHLASTRCGARHLQPLRRSSEPEEEKHRAAAAARAWRGKGTRLAMAAARRTARGRPAAEQGPRAAEPWLTPAAPSHGRAPHALAGEAPGPELPCAGPRWGGRTAEAASPRSSPAPARRSGCPPRRRLGRALSPPAPRSTGAGAAPNPRRRRAELGRRPPWRAVRAWACAAEQGGRTPAAMAPRRSSAAR